MVDILEKIADFYDLSEGLSRTPRDDDKLEESMPKNYKMIFRLVRRLIRIFLVASFVVFMYMLITRDWSIFSPLFFFILLPNSVFSIIKQQMRKYAKRKFN